MNDCIQDGFKVAGSVIKNFTPEAVIHLKTNKPYSRLLLKSLMPAYTIANNLE